MFWMFLKPPQGGGVKFKWSCHSKLILFLSLIKPIQLGFGSICKFATHLFSQ